MSVSKPRLMSICWLLVLPGLLVLVLSPSRNSSAADPVMTAMDRAVQQFLVKRQNADGGYGPQDRIEGMSDVGITAMVLYGIALHPRDYKAVDGPFVSRAVKFLLGRQQSDGAFYDPKDPVLQNYRTSVVVLALTALHPVLYAEPIRKARDFVRQGQLDESADYIKDEHLPYGGYGYGSGMRADLNNSTMAAEALVVSGVSGSDPSWKKLEAFLANCQNTPDVGPLLAARDIGTSGDGGFRYAPNTTRGPERRLADGTTILPSYGSMTYQGLRALFYAQVPRDDPRVQMAMEWIAKHFTVTENPGMATKTKPGAGSQGLYFYYHAMAKTLALYGQAVIVDGQGRKHHWPRELSAQLVSLQRPGGYWVNDTGRWWEDVEELDTAYALIALSLCHRELEKEKAAGDKAAAATTAKRPAPEPAAPASRSDAPGKD